MTAVAEYGTQTGSRLSAALDAAVKAQNLLPDNTPLADWRVTEDGATALLMQHQKDDTFTSAWIVSLAQQPGWSFSKNPPRRSEFTGVWSVEIAAVTEIDGVPVRIWAHIGTDVIQVASTNGAAA